VALSAYPYYERRWVFPTSPSGRQLPSLGQRRADEAAADFTPLTDALLAENDHVGREHQAAQSPTQTHRLLEEILHSRLDHKEVQVAVRASLSPRVGAEEDHSRPWWRGFREPPTGVLDRHLVNHEPTVSRDGEETPAEGRQTAAAADG
jgi:hypothetical protein